MVPVVSLGMAALTVAVLVVVTLAIVPPRSVWLGLRSFERRTGTSPAATLAAGVLGLLLLAIGLAGSNIGGDFGYVDGLVTVVGALGPLGVAVGLASSRIASRLATASACPTGDPDTGLVAVDGALQAVEDTLAVPGVDSGAVSCTYALQKDRGLAHRSPVWATIAEGERTRPFAVDDGSGAVRVDTEGVDVRGGGSVRGGYSVDLPEDEPVSDSVASFLAEAGVDSPGRPDADHRLRLRPLGPGDTATVVGEYDRVTRPGEAFWGISDGDGAAVLLAGDLASARGRLGRRARWLTGVGVTVTLGSVGYVAALFVPVPFL
jgi:hypothetical protein